MIYDTYSSSEVEETVMRRTNDVRQFKGGRCNLKRSLVHSWVFVANVGTKGENVVEGGDVYAALLAVSLQNLDVAKDELGEGLER